MKKDKGYMARRILATKLMTVAWLTLWIMNLSLWALAVYATMHFLRVW